MYVKLCYVCGDSQTTTYMKHVDISLTGKITTANELQYLSQ